MARNLEQHEAGGKWHQSLHVEASAEEKSRKVIPNSA